MIVCMRLTQSQINILIFNLWAPMFVIMSLSKKIVKKESKFLNIIQYYGGFLSHTQINILIFYLYLIV